MAPGPSTSILKSYFFYSELCFTAHRVCLKSAGPVLFSPVPQLAFSSPHVAEKDINLPLRCRSRFRSSAVGTSRQGPGKLRFHLEKFRLFFADGEIIRSTRNRLFFRSKRTSKTSRENNIFVICLF